MIQTENINLPILQEGDKYSKDIQNQAFRDIDREIKGLNDRVKILDNVEGSIIETKEDVESLKINKADTITTNNKFEQTNQQINKINEQLEQNINKLKNIVTYDVAQHKLFDKEDLSVALNDIFSKIKNGDIVYLHTGETVKALNTINFPSWKENITVKIMDCINWLGEGFLFNIEEGQQKSLFEIEKVVCNNFVNSAFNITSTHHTLFNIREILNADKAIKLNGSVNNGSQYNTFNCEYIKANDCIVLDAIDQSGWVSENIFNGRYCGKNAITFTPINDLSEELKLIKYEMNEFINVGFEGLSGYCAKLYNSTGTRFINFRLFAEENTMSEYFIDQQGYNKGTFYSTTCITKAHFYDNVTSVNTKIVGRIFNETSRVSYNYIQIISKGAFTEKVYFNDDTFLNLAFKNGTKRVDFTLGTGNKSFKLDKLYEPLWVQNKNANNKLIIPDQFLYDGASFSINLEFKDSNNLSVYNQYNSKLFDIPQLMGNGVYRLTYFKEQETFKWIRETQQIYS